MTRTAVLPRILATSGVVWAGALILGAFIASRPEPGPVMYVVSAVIYEVGSLICHQRPERSFHLWGAQLPVCARCAGIYAGAAAAALAAVIAGAGGDRDRAVRHASPAIVVAALPTVLTLLYEWTTGQMPGNWTRAAAGFPLALVAWIVVASSTPRSAVGIH